MSRLGIDDGNLFDYDTAATPSLVGIEYDGGLRVTEARLPALDGRLTPITLIQPQERPPAAELLIAHGGSDDGRHLFRDEAQQLARAGLAVALPATFLPPRGNWSRSELAIRRATRDRHAFVLDALLHD